MQHKYFKNGGSVGNDGLREIYENVEGADALHMALLHGYGILSGMGVSENSPTPDLNVLAAVGQGWNEDGEYISIPTIQTLDCSIDRDSTSTLPSGSNERYISVVAKPAKAQADSVTDPVTGTLYQTETDYFLLEVVSGTEAGSGSGVAPTIGTDELLLADIGPILSSTVEITDAMIDTTTRVQTVAKVEALTISSDDPQAPGTADPGATGEVADAGHVHPSESFTEIDPIQTALNGGTATTYTEVDLSSIVPAGTEWVLLQVQTTYTAPSNGSYGVQVRVREAGSSMDGSAPAIGGTFYITNGYGCAPRGQLWVKVSAALKIEYKNITSSMSTMIYVLAAK